MFLHFQMKTRVLAAAGSNRHRKKGCHQIVAFTAAKKMQREWREKKKIGEPMMRTAENVLKSN